MKRLFFVSILFLLFCGEINMNIYGQISYGGSPAFYTNSLKALPATDLVVEMPSFDVNVLQEEDRLNEMGNSRSFRFAHKFYVDIERGKLGQNYVLPDGTKIWQVAIRSKGAHSINVLFSEFHLPEGARLFLYNSDHSQVIGSFTSENNSDERMFPVRPISGDEIIVEYSEPFNAAFEGKLKISEVNHDYRNVLRLEPENDPANSACMPDVLCKRSEDPNRRSEVLLIINGTVKCCGTLLNNASNDRTPYLLTATHCFNSSFSVKNPNYTYLAGSIVAFFNYDRPVCATNMRGTENLSLSGAVPVCIIDTTDLSLLRFKETPPDYYNPYYSGWNIEYDKSSKTHTSFPFISIHHPSGAVKKIGEYNKPAKLITFNSSVYRFYPEAHWEIAGWDVGSTATGSSGSGLFDNNGLLVGGLSGGASLCNGVNPNGEEDYYFSLFKSWDFQPIFGTQPLRKFLDPDNRGLTKMAGFDPNASNSLVRLRNANYNGSDLLANDTLKTGGKGYVFGNSTLKTIEFAEEFNISKGADVLGVYLLMPKTTTTSVASVKIIVYKGREFPEEEIFQTTFNPEYTNYNKSDSSFNQSPRLLSYPTENFIRFNGTVKIPNKFFVAYRITESNVNGFSVYNAKLTQGKSNTAWIKEPFGTWVKATNYSYQPTSPTSLALQPLIRYTGVVGMESIHPNTNHPICYDRESRRLTINTENEEFGTVFIYSMSGLLIEKFDYQSGTFIYLNSLPKGNVGIVKFVSNKNENSTKIIF